MPRNQGCAGPLLTDLYELTMACAYWKAGKADQEAVFELFFRTAPFHCGFTVAAGLAPALDFLAGFCFTEEDRAFLAALRGNDGQPLFDEKFLDYLGALRFACDVHAIPEGTAVFPLEPLLRIQGPILQCQLLETALLNLINFQSLVATKAARVCLAAQGEPVLEFGLRRAQGVDGALAASRAAHIGGCDATSNVLAGKLYGIPVRGTHAHSWVMSFDDEREAFRAYAEATPNNCIFLVDTYETLEGVRRAVEVGRWLRDRGHEMAGIRLDSGDLAWLSIEARKILDDAGFPNAVIVASNELDEHIIASLKDQGARINVWGVGTKLVTAYDQPALGGVYKLGAVRRRDGRWHYKVKLSEQTAKISTPGIHQVRRFRSGREFIADAIYDVEQGAPEQFTMVDPWDPTRRKHVAPGTAFEDLLIPVFKKGRPVYQSPPLHEIRRRTQSQLAMFHPGVKRFINPHQYPVGLESGLYDLKTELILRARGEK
ncbi:MAG: nicotinate phosphoribosyltransferase [Verrucomicrobiota bacterium]|nr:nicotinate phosphoribosyltransferase [Verrucomicrobiota bacterium]